MTVPATAVLISLSFDGKMDGVAQAMLINNSTTASKRIFLKDAMRLSFFETDLAAVHFSIFTAKHAKIAKF